MKSDNAIADKSFEFAVRIVNLAKHLRMEEKEFVLSKQLLRSGTSIGANVAEGQRAQSRTDYLSKEGFGSSKKDADELIYILTAICKTASAKKE